MFTGTGERLGEDPQCRQRSHSGANEANEWQGCVGEMVCSACHHCDMMSLNRMTNDRLLNTMTQGKTSRSAQHQRTRGY